MKKLIFSLFFLSVFTALSHAQDRTCTQWETYKDYKGRQLTRCKTWDYHRSAPVAAPATPAVAPVCEWQTVQDRFGNEFQQCIPKEKPVFHGTCKNWQTVAFKNDTRQTTCKLTMTPDQPGYRAICREYVTTPLDKTIAKKQKAAWLSECSKFDYEKNGQPCGHWKYAYQKDGSVVSSCATYMSAEEVYPAFQWEEYIDAEGIPAHLLLNQLKKDRYMCLSFQTSKMDKKGKRTVTCTKFSKTAFF